MKDPNSGKQSQCLHTLSQQLANNDVPSYQGVGESPVEATSAPNYKQGQTPDRPWYETAELCKRCVFVGSVMFFTNTFGCRKMYVITFLKWRVRLP